MGRVLRRARSSAVKGLDDGPDGLNETAFERALGGGRKRKPVLRPVNAETITVGQIQSLRHAASDHAVTVACKRAVQVAELRSSCEQACRDIAEANPTGMSIEHLNARLLEVGLELGRAIIAREQCVAAWNMRNDGKVTP